MSRTSETRLRRPTGLPTDWPHLGTGPHSFGAGRRVLYRLDDLHD